MVAGERITYIGDCEDLKVFNKQALIDLVISFYYCGDTKFDFPDITGVYFIIYNERLGRQLRDLSYAVTRSDNNLVINASEADMTFDANGKYWYELGYIRGGAYETVLRYGKLLVV
jgi:hypothetical protein